MDYKPRFIENMTIEQIDAEIREDHERQYRYGYSIDWMRHADLNYTKEILKNKEETNMTESKAITFTLDGITFSSNEKGNRFYKTFENGQKTRISELEWMQSLSKYNELTWEQEADAEKKAREDKMAEDALKAAEALGPKKTAKRAKKNAAFELDGVTLTEKQVDFIKHIPDTCFYENGLESTMWIDVLADEIGGQFAEKPMTVGAMISTLREKDLIYVAEDRVNGRKCKFFGFTELGKRVASELGLK